MKKSNSLKIKSASIFYLRIKLWIHLHDMTEPEEVVNEEARRPSGFLFHGRRYQHTVGFEFFNIKSGGSES